MQSALRSRRDGEDIQIYGHSSADFSNPGTSYTAFPAPIQHVDPAIEQDISSYNNRHGEDSNAPHLVPHVSNVSNHIAHSRPLEVGQSHQLVSALTQPIPSPNDDDRSSQTPTGESNEPTSHTSESFQPYGQQPLDQDPPQIPNSAPPGQFDMLPPPNSMHTSWQALHDYAQTHASDHGYALSINTTAKNRARIKLACVCYGAPKNTHKLTPQTRIRKNRVSYKTGCKMWVEGKKLEDGLWMLRVGEPAHNHPGRAVEGWALQRKRTWGVEGGRIGVGGVTAKEEKAKEITAQDGEPSIEVDEPNSTSQQLQQHDGHSLERGGIVWKIVEQEMLRKGGPSQGRDRGVGRTVKVLEERLPGIHIFKRDVYNIRAQIKRARKAAGQQIGDGLNEDHEHEREEELEEVASSARIQGRVETPNQLRSNIVNDTESRSFPEIDPQLVAQCNDALKSVTRQEESEVDQLRKENEQLRQALAQRDKEVEEKNSENENLRAQVQLANLALYNGRHGPTHSLP